MCQPLLSGVGYMPTPNVHSDVWNCIESYTIYMLLACRLKITFTFNLKLIISFLVQLQHLLLPSLIVTSSQVRVGTLFLFNHAVSLAWGQKAYYTIVRFRVVFLLRVTLASRGNSASKNLQWETQRPTCCLYEMPYIAAPVRETGDVIARTPLYAQLPTDAPTRTRIFFGSRVMHFSRDPSC